MKDSSRSKQSTEWKERPAITVGLDLGDRSSHYCMLNPDGDVIEEGRISTNEAALQRQFEGEAGGPAFPRQVESLIWGVPHPCRLFLATGWARGVTVITA